MAELQFVKFPRTPHLFVMGPRAPRGDKLVDDDLARRLLGLPATAEEKLDGTNLGISVADDGRLRAQNRGAYVEAASHPQYQPLGTWLGMRTAKLRDALADDLILFGEWCVARHTVSYDALPDWFLAFDVYDRKAGRFWSRARRDELCSSLAISTVPLLAQRVVGRAAMEALLGPSRVAGAPMEGIYLRWDDGEWLAHRAKVVRGGWVPPDDEHWKFRALEANRLAGKAT